MASISHQSIDRRLDTYHTGLINTRDVAELQDRLACEDAPRLLEMLGITVKGD